MSLQPRNLGFSEPTYFSASAKKLCPGARAPAARPRRWPLPGCAPHARAARLTGAPGQRLCPLFPPAPSAACTALGTQGKGAAWQTKRSAGKEPRPPPTGATAGRTGGRCAGVTSLCPRLQAPGGLLWASTSPSAYQWLGWKVSNSGSPNCLRSTRGYQGCRSGQAAAAPGGLGGVRGPLWGQPGSAQLLELRGGWQQDTGGAGVPGGLLALNPTPPGLRGKLAAPSSCHLGLEHCPGE